MDNVFYIINDNKVELSNGKEYSLVDFIDVLVNYINQLETNRDEVIKYIKENNLWSSNKTQNGYSYMKNECRELLSILERGENNEIINE